MTTWLQGMWAMPIIRSLLGSIVLIVIGKLILYPITAKIIASMPHTKDDVGFKGRVHAIRDAVHMLGNAILFCIMIFLVLSMTFNIFGIDIVPTLLSAGVITIIVSVIVGLAMQAMIKDVIAWLFNIYEDRYRVGEQVKFNMALEGTITAMHMRFLNIRDDEKKVHSVPNSWINVVSNHTRPQ